MEILWVLFGLCAALRLYAVVEEAILEWGTRPRYVSYLEMKSLYDECGAENCNTPYIGVCTHPIGEFVTDYNPIRWVKQVRWRK